MFKRLYFFIFFLLASFSAFASPDYAGERAYYEDPTNQLTFSEVQSKTFIPFQKLLSKGYSNSTFWVRLKVLPTDERDTKLVLRLQPNYLDEIQLYDPVDPVTHDRLVGDRHYLSRFENFSFAYDFLIPAKSEPRYVWLRLKTTSTNLMVMHISNRKDAELADRNFNITASVILAIQILLLLWAAFYGWIFKDKLIAVFLVRQLSAILFFITFVGYSRSFFSHQFSPSVFDEGLSILVLATSATAFWFHLEFFKDYQLHRRLQLVFYLGLLLFPIELLLFFIGMLTQALKINMVMVLCVPIYMFFISVFGIPWKKLQSSVSVLPRQSLIIFHAIYLLITAVTALPSLGLPGLTEFAPQAALLHGLITGLVMMVMVMFRSRKMNQQAVLGMALAKQEVLIERKRREEQGHFLGMLTHEFKNSLGILKLSIASLEKGSKQARYAELAVDGMNEIVDRCTQVQNLVHDNVVLDISEFSLDVFLKEICKKSKYPELIKIDGNSEIKLSSDKKLLRMIFSNLIDNAFKYGKTGAVVEVVVTQAIHQGRRECRLRVTNQVGKVGFPDPDKVFTKYYRAPLAYQQIGSGLGLYLISQLAQMLGASLHYISTDHKVSFELCLVESTL